MTTLLSEFGSAGRGKILGLEGDEEICAEVGGPEVAEEVVRSTAEIEGGLGKRPEVLLAARRYGYIAAVCQEAVQMPAGEARTKSDCIDSVVTNRWLAFPISFCLISAPCMATLAVIQRESGYWRWAIGQWLGLTALAWMLAFFVYQVGSRIGF